MFGHKQLMQGFSSNEELLDKYVISGQLCYVYSNGYVLPQNAFPHDEHIYSDEVQQWDLWLREHPILEPGHWEDNLPQKFVDKWKKPQKEDKNQWE